jgi:ABC-type nitrate/sulfonate/bicarbonate transport system permease component
MRTLAPAFVARPSGVVAVILRVLSDAQFLAAAGATLRAVLEGLLLSIVLGTVIGLAMGRVVTLERGLRYYVNSLFATPMVAILPLMSLWFGYDGDARLATVVFAALFSVVVNTCDGARAVPNEYLEVAHAFRARGWRTLFDVCCLRRCHANSQACGLLRASTGRLSSRVFRFDSRARLLHPL